MAWYYKHEESNNQKWRHKKKQKNLQCNVKQAKGGFTTRFPMFFLVFAIICTYSFSCLIDPFFLFCWERFWWNKYKQTPFILLQILLVYSMKGGGELLMLLLFISLESFALQLLLLFSCHPLFLLLPSLPAVLNQCRRRCRPPSLPLSDPLLFVVK